MIHRCRQGRAFRQASRQPPVVSVVCSTWNPTRRSACWQSRSFPADPSSAPVGLPSSYQSTAAVPVWYRWDGRDVRVRTDEERLWVRNLRRDPRVAFSVQEARPPFGAVTMRGQAELRTADADDEIRRITRRYLAEDELDGYLAEWSHLRSIVCIRPATIRAWTRGY